MTIAPPILEHFTDLNEEQKAIVGHINGPLLVVAGPGSGKTYCFILRALNLLLLEEAAPRQIILCTFTEKAAFEMRDRLAAAAQEVGYEGNLSEVNVSTIHSLCNKLLTQHRHRTELGHNYETLDELTQLLFIFDHFDEIIGPAQEERYLGRWTTKWTAIDGARKYLDKITEELIDPHQLTASDDPFISAIGRTYLAYRRVMLESNHIDFAHLQRLVFELLADPALAEAVTRDIKHVLVDEYQDTNYVQEQLLFKLSEKTKNLCVVGDEDQSLYRFRGATVRNILEFPKLQPECRVIELSTNYRSHEKIVERYDRWMASIDWSNPNGPPFRYEKSIHADPEEDYPEYPAVFAIWGRNRRDEAQRLADFTDYLMKNEIIQDYSQVALLLHSVRQEHSGPYLEALEERGIKVFCPRARAYFDNGEIRDILACFAVLFGWYGDARGDAIGAVAEVANYIDNAIVNLGRRFPDPDPLAQTLQNWTSEIAGLDEGDSLDFRPADYFYRLLAFEPFKTYVKNENSARNLAIFSQLLSVFQSYYHYTVVTYRNRSFIRMHLFNSFIRLLYDGGINEYEDPDRPFPKEHVQVMTIHQAKGLEFPVVVVGSLSSRLSSQKRVDRDLSPHYHREPFEPEARITQFDRMRLHYVAFSRAQKVLVLTAHETPKEYFFPIWEGLEQWPYVEKELLLSQSFHPRERMPVKRAYSFTGDLKIYETCPRQYLFFREYDFTPSRSAVIFFGLLVHQSIEEIHRIALDGKLEDLEKDSIRELFDRTYSFLCLSDVRPIGAAAKESAFEQVMDYFLQNKEEMRRIVETEVDVSIEKEGYILTGKVDLLMGGDGRLELLDFKTSPRPADSPELLAAYERQLCTYAHILEHKHGHEVERLLLYWTSEPKKEDALMVLPYDPNKVEEAGRHFEEVVRQIQAKDFRIESPPETSICKECDLRMLCATEGIATHEVKE